MKIIIWITIICFFFYGFGIKKTPQLSVKEKIIGAWKLDSIEESNYYYVKISESYKPDDSSWKYIFKKNGRVKYKGPCSFTCGTLVEKKTTWTLQSDSILQLGGKNGVHMIIKTLHKDTMIVIFD